MQSDCNESRQLLWSYLTNELSDSETKQIEQHLQGCPSCRQEAEELSQVLSSFHEDIPLPAAFTETLHEKLVAVSHEMATKEPSFKERLGRSIKELPGSRGFRTLAPALVCLVLVVSVFHSGLFDTWNSADKILTDSDVSTPVSTSTPALSKGSGSAQQKTTTDTPSTTTSATTSSSSAVPSPSATSPAASTSVSGTNTFSPSEAPKDSSPASSTKVSDTPSAPPSVSETHSHITDAPLIVSYDSPESSASPASESVPAPASAISEDIPVGHVVPRSAPAAICLMFTADTETLLDGWQESSGYDWESSVKDIPPQEILPGVDPDATVLELSTPATESLVDYAKSVSNVQETQEETLVIITADEE